MPNWGRLARFGAAGVTATVFGSPATAIGILGSKRAISSGRRIGRAVGGMHGSVKTRTMGAASTFLKNNPGVARRSPRTARTIRAAGAHPMIAGAGLGMVALQSKGRSTGASASYRNQNDMYLRRVRRHQSAALSGLQGISIGGMTGY